MDEIVWNVLTHEHKDRTADWYWALGLVTVLGAAAAIYFGNILLAAIILIGAICVATLVIRGPREHEVRIDGRGIHIDGTLYRYPNVQAFCVAVDEPLPERAHEVRPRTWLIFDTTGYLHPRITVPLVSINHGHQVREYLLNFLDEEELHPYFAEHLAELLGL